MEKPYRTFKAFKETPEALKKMHMSHSHQEKHYFQKLITQWGSLSSENIMLLLCVIFVF